MVIYGYYRYIRRHARRREGVCTYSQVDCRAGDSANERYSWDAIKPDFMWILNYGAPGPSQKGMWWVLHKQKQLFGQQDSGHTAFVINPAIHLMGYTGSKTPPEFQHYPDKEYTVGHQFRKDPTYRRQLVCSVYDSSNNYLSIYVQWCPLWREAFEHV